MEAPFITLRSHTSSGSSLTLHNPSNIDLPKPPQLDLTHYNFHTKDVAVLAQTMEVVANKTLPNRGPSRYKEVKVLLLRWEEDDLEVEWELNELSIIFQAYGFDTETYLIPSQSSHTKLNRKASDFVEQSEDENNLLIVYYGGHASINNARQLSWSCKRQPGSSSLNWSAIQSLFEHSQSDVLLLLDCCAAAAATPMPIDTGSSTEMIAACGWEQRAPEPGIHSFTNAIIDVLEDWLEKRPVFSTAQLFREVADVLKQPRPRRNMETSTTPVHLVTTLNPKAPSIELRRKVGKQVPDATMAVGRSSTSISNVEANNLLGELSQQDEVLCKSSFNLSGEGIAQPHFIFAAALKEDQILETKQFIDWIKQFPATVQHTLVQGLHLRYPKLSELPMLTSERAVFSRKLASELIEQAISDVPQETKRPVDSAPISPRYKEVHALLLRWEDDPMGISWEVDDLAKVFETAYGFRTEIWLIPNEASFFSVLSKAIKMVEDFGKEGNLMIVYYYGHGLINSFRHAIWYCKQGDEDGKRSSLDWSLIQAVFDEAKSDILVLLDCCAAASGAPTKCHSNRVTETIAACGFETFTTTPGRHSFTSALIDVLEDWTVRPYFTAAMLHCEIFSRLRHEKPEIRERLNKAFDRHRTPIHILSTSDPEARSVELRPQHGIARTRSLGNGRLRLSSKSTISSQLKGFSQPDYSSVKVEDEL